MKVKITTKNNVRFVVPVPYMLLKGCVSLISSPIFWSQVKKMTKHHPKATVWIPESLDKNTLRVFVSSLKTHKGLTLVDVDLKDDLKVKVIL